jgi:hypothetical protein
MTAAPREGRRAAHHLGPSVEGRTRVLSPPGTFTEVTPADRRIMVQAQSSPERARMPISRKPAQHLALPVDWQHPNGPRQLTASSTWSQIQRRAFADLGQTRIVGKTWIVPGVLVTVQILARPGVGHETREWTRQISAREPIIS